MRLTAGKHRGRVLVAPTGLDTRPTSDKVRQAVFNILAHHPGTPLLDAVVLDGFCGTGALGLEALSRGAAFAHFIDQSPAALAALRQNIAATREEKSSLVLSHDITRLPPRPAHLAPATLLFLDPPYRKGLIPTAIQSLSQGNWLSDPAFCVLETASDESAPALPGFTLLSQRTYGEAAVWIGWLSRPPP
jgi:16S rRNA (guanine966-N2)-methyltransferase